MKIVLATRNKGKLHEIRSILSEVGDYEVLSLLDFSDIPKVNEDRFTYAGNAIKKASTIAKLKGIPTLADDSGLEVDALDGDPGVRSARFAGLEASYKDNNRKLLKMLEGIPQDKRTARFQCAMAFVKPSGWIEVTTGTYEGVIISKPRGDNGFGYDPLFYVPHIGKTFAELTSDEKNQISHRRIALEKMKRILPCVIST